MRSYLQRELRKKKEGTRKILRKKRDEEMRKKDPPKRVKDPKGKEKIKEKENHTGTLINEVVSARERVNTSEVINIHSLSNQL
jgi:hypothetical protein